MVRYADDILILCCSESAAINALDVATRYLEGPLKLTVNADKTHIAHSRNGVKFLGVVIHTRFTQIQATKVQALKAKVKCKRSSNPTYYVKTPSSLIFHGSSNS